MLRQLKQLGMSAKEMHESAAEFEFLQQLSESGKSVQTVGELMRSFAALELPKLRGDEERKRKVRQMLEQRAGVPLKMLRSYFRFFALKPHVMVDKVLQAIDLNPQSEGSLVSFKKFLLAKSLVVEKYRRYL